MFHPDKVNKDIHGVKHYVLMEEVSKIFTWRYNETKGMRKQLAPRRSTRRK